MREIEICQLSFKITLEEDCGFCYSCCTSIVLLSQRTLILIMWSLYKCESVCVWVWNRERKKDRPQSLFELRTTVQLQWCQLCVWVCFFMNVWKIGYVCIKKVCMCVSQHSPVLNKSCACEHILYHWLSLNFPIERLCMSRCGFLDED